MKAIAYILAAGFLAGCYGTTLPSYYVKDETPYYYVKDKPPMTSEDKQLKLQHDQMMLYYGIQLLNQSRPYSPAWQPGSFGNPIYIRHQ